MSCLRSEEDLLEKDIYDTVSSRISRPITAVFFVYVCVQASIDRVEGFFGLTKELDDDAVKRYKIVAFFCACWLLYELTISVYFFVDKYKNHRRNKQ